MYYSIQLVNGINVKTKQFRLEVQPENGTCVVRHPHTPHSVHNNQLHVLCRLTSDIL